MSDRIKRTRAAWGGNPPDFVLTIARACDLPGSSQNKVARQLNYSAALVSCVLSNTYKGDLDAVAQSVRISLLDSKITCPEVGELLERHCLKWRQNAKAETLTSPQEVRMFRACTGCPRFLEDKS